MLKENSKAVFYAVKNAQEEGRKVTAADIASLTGLTVKQVNGSITSAFQRKGLMERVEGEVQLADETHQKVKWIYLTELGMAFDPEAPDPVKAE